MPGERYNAVIKTRELLRDLISIEYWSVIPKDIRLRAAGCMRHYPTEADMDLAAHQVPALFKSDRVLDDVEVFLRLGEQSSK